MNNLEESVAQGSQMKVSSYSSIKMENGRN